MPTVLIELKMILDNLKMVNHLYKLTETGYKKEYLYLDSKKIDISET
jgi:hypothetical protein